VDLTSPLVLSRRFLAGLREKLRDITKFPLLENRYFSGTFTLCSTLIFQGAQLVDFVTKTTASSIENAANLAQQLLESQVRVGK
jgi:hypothetical protein